MSQSSGTTRLQDKDWPELMQLGYPLGRCQNQYYTAQIDENYGVCVAPMLSAIFIQFFPWGINGVVTSPTNGHEHYCNFIMRQSSSLDQKYMDLPYFKLELDTDILTIKCLIEEGIKQCQLSSR